mmetsp:Transcript_20858/g.31956  ORF Transcript_20858/g.31956 Transcript_20858/m.31956 type:complete len:499 (-) Transcript_20858:1696-3192(-)
MFRFIFMFLVSRGQGKEEKKCDVHELLLKIRKEFWTEKIQSEKNYTISKKSCGQAILDRKSEVVHFIGEDGGGAMEIISDERVPGLVHVPRPVIRNGQVENILCRPGTRLWSMCPANKLSGLPQKLRQAGGDDFWLCNYRRYIARIKCGKVDENDIISDSKYTYTRHVSGELEYDFKSTGATQSLPWYDEIAVHFGVGSAATGHYLNQLPRLFQLIALVPQHIPIAVRSHSMADKFAHLFEKYGFVQPGRFVQFCTERDVAKGRQPSPTCKTQKGQYFHGLRAGNLYYAAEAALNPNLNIIRLLSKGKFIHQQYQNKSKPWFGLALEACSWQMAQSRFLLRRLMACALNIQKQSQQQQCRILVVDRRDAKSRMLHNHAKLMATLRSELPTHCSFFEFVGSKLSLEQQIAAFLSADLVIAPHGAALGFIGFMRPGAAVIEITYIFQGKTGPLIFFAAAQSAKLRYYLSVALSGKHSTALTADIPDIVTLAKRALLTQEH